MQVGDATGAFLMRHTALPRNGGAMQNAAGNPIRKKVPAFPALPKIYFPLILLALADIWDNLSRIFRDKGEHSGFTHLKKKMREGNGVWLEEIQRP